MSILKFFDQTVPYVSGYSMRSRYIAESLARRGVDVNVVSSSIFDYRNEIETINGVNYFRAIPVGSASIRRLPLLREWLTVRSVREAAQRHWDSRFQLVHAHSSSLNGLAARAVAKQYNVPFLYEIRAFWEDAAVDQGKTKEGSFRYNVTRNLETKLLRSADRASVISEGLKMDVIERGIDPEKIIVTPNGVDTEKFTPQPYDREIAEKLGLTDCQVIGFIGTFFRFEGLHLLLEAAKQLCAERDDLKVLIVGGGHEEMRLKAMTKEYGLEDRVIFTGRVKHDDVLRYYSVIDILVYPRTSRRITELVTPLKPLEAMALKKVVIGSDVGGIRELVEDGRNGLLFPAENVDELVNRCRFALNSPQEMQSLAEMSREYVIRERNWYTLSQRYVDLYQSLELSLPCGDRNHEMNRMAESAGV